jgi:hypothetical protein
MSTYVSTEVWGGFSSAGHTTEVFKCELRRDDVLGFCFRTQYFVE